MQLSSRDQPQPLDLRNKSIFPSSISSDGDPLKIVVGSLKGTCDGSPFDSLTTSAFNFSTRSLHTRASFVLAGFSFSLPLLLPDLAFFFDGASDSSLSSLASDDFSRRLIALCPDSLAVAGVFESGSS